MNVVEVSRITDVLTFLVQPAWQVQKRPARQGLFGNKIERWRILNQLIIVIIIIIIIIIVTIIHIIIIIVIIIIYQHHLAYILNQVTTE